MDKTPESHKILVIKLGAFGDFIQALGPMAAIRAHHKDAQITLMTTKPFLSFGQECGYFDAVLIDEKPRLFDIQGWMRLCLTLNAGGFDRVYDLQNNDRTALYFKLFSMKNQPEWVGAARGASHRNCSKTRTAGHAFDGHVETLALAGIENIGIDTLKWMQGDLSSFDLKTPYVLLVPGSAPSRPEKRWPAAHFAQLSKFLIARGVQPVILGTASESALAQTIAAENPFVLNLTEHTDFHQIAALARNAAGAIGNDTGPMHLIAATGCSSLVLFSKSSNPLRHAPKGAAVEILQSDNLENLKAETVFEKFKSCSVLLENAITRH
jgi:ADP-heptose:LPS heptosyltransferase